MIYTRIHLRTNLPINLRFININTFIAYFL